MRHVESAAGRELTEDEVYTRYYKTVKLLREKEKVGGIEQIEIIREWVWHTAPALDQAENEVGKRTQSGPLHEVMTTASEILGREHDHDAHPHKESGKIIVEIRRFNEAICAYFRTRKSKDEL